jgi:hypothetical protein
MWQMCAAGTGAAAAAAASANAATAAAAAVAWVIAIVELQAPLSWLGARLPAAVGSDAIIIYM